jgi:RNA polymerase sigma-70 factor (ECF subfamily)
MAFFSMSHESSNELPLSDAELLAQSRTKPWLFAELVARYEAPFLRRAERIIHNPADAEEIVQDTFTKIYLHSDTFVVQEGAQFSSWAYRILLNTAFTYYQKRVKAGQRFTILDPEFEALVADTSHSRDGKEATDAVARVLAVLPSHFAQVLRLHYLERWSHQAIADETGDSVGAIKVRIFRAKQAYKAEQARLGEEPIL